MFDKKYLLLAAFCALFSVNQSEAQENTATNTGLTGKDMTYRGENYDLLDSNFYTGKRLDQYRRYINHQTVFPPKPNNMWEIGISAGFSNIFGDMPSQSFLTAKKPMNAVGLGLTVRKSIGYFLSVRGQFLIANATGMDYRPHYVNEEPWKDLNYPSDKPYIYNNYKTSIMEGSVQLVGALNNINFHNGKNKMSIYGFIGGGAMSVKVGVNALDANGQTYKFAPNLQTGYAGITGFPGSGVNAVTYDDRKIVYDQLNSMLDDTYESDPYNNTSNGTSKSKILPVITTGLGVQFKVNNRFAIQFEEKLSFTGDDLLDGSRLQSTEAGTLSPSSDVYNYASVGLNYSIGNKSKKVAPLWWVNPLDHAYSELSDPRHMRVPDAVLVDTDNDGVADQFDKCPGTPDGVAVDPRGCPMDTDGDGVPDFRDRELITPTNCQPVDADGVGKCPCPDGCEGKESTKETKPNCGNISSGNLNFSGNSSAITPVLKTQLANIANQMKANPTCKLVFIGNGSDSKLKQQRSWDRVNALISHMSDMHGIDRNRFIFQYGGNGDANTVIFRSANEGEEGPSNVAPPFPNLRKD